MNNYNYNRSVYLLNMVTHHDNGISILNESAHYPSPISVTNYEYYDDIEVLIQKLENDNDLIQCIVTELFKNNKTVEFGMTQSPGLNDYADGIDTMRFLTEL
jgi:hypothetical protein